MPGDLFVDTSAWYPLVLATDPHHAAVASAFREQVSARARIVTTNLVVRSTVELEARAVTDWLSRYEDQGFSLTDAVSFGVMRELGIAEALALDVHHAAAGFRMLPLDPTPSPSRRRR